MSEQAEVTPAIYSLNKQMAAELAMTGKFNAPHGMETEPLSDAEVEGHVKHMMRQARIGARGIFFYRTVEKKPKMLMAIKVEGGVQTCAFDPDDPRLIPVLDLSRH